jgi:hypothetical protein
MVQIESIYRWCLAWVAGLKAIMVSDCFHPLWVLEQGAKNLWWIGRPTLIVQVKMHDIS